jgi:hypothetical protein
MTGKVMLLTILLTLGGYIALAQKTPADPLAMDSIDFEDYDVLFSEMDAFFDSLLRPRNYLLAQAGVTRSNYNYESASGYGLRTTEKFTCTPSLTYFHKSGFGFGGSANVVNDSGKINPYLFTLTGAYDYIRNRKFITGISVSRYFTKDSLSFYTSPLQNEIYAYFAYRALCVRPSVSINYGWGSRTDYTEREEYIESFRLRPNGYTRINTRESITDFNVSASLRKDIYFLDVLSGNDFIRISPQVSFVSGTQKFGFNQSSNTYGRTRLTGANVLYNSENIYLDDEMAFQPLSLTAFLKTEYSIGKFFIQPQLVVDYYFPAKEKNISTIAVLNAGVIF